MEARSVDEIPTTKEWQYEPKWDGFRCLTFRNRSSIELQSKSEKPFGRYFPEIVQAVRELKPQRFALDGELVVPIDGKLDFDQLLQRIHPAESRVRRLSAEHPALLVVFDFLEDETGQSMMELPLSQRRSKLESFARHFPKKGLIRLSPASTNLAQGRRWYRKAGGDTDGLIAKRLDAAYQPGGRDAMVKIKPSRTADCVVGGFRYSSRGKTLGSLLLGLYDEKGLLHHVGFTSTLRAADRAAELRKLEKLREPPGFTGSAPVSPSRWSTRRSSEWEPLRPSLVVEVNYDHFSGGRFRHGTTFHRWRPDKDPRQCTFDQIKHAAGADLTWLDHRMK
jgi:ATP-dependent DNA ligase